MSLHLKCNINNGDIFDDTSGKWSSDFIHSSFLSWGCRRCVQITVNVISVRRFKVWREWKMLVNLVL